MGALSSEKARDEGAHGVGHMWSVEQAVEDDVEEILRVQREAFEANQKHYEIDLPEMTETAAELLDDMTDATVLVARERNLIVGAIRYRISGGTCQAYRLAVAPAYSHLDVGRSLMRAMEKRAEADPECREIVIATRLRDAPAIAFSLRMGYRPFQLLPDPNMQLDAVRFAKRLR